ncbi:hypothetical protein HNY73_014097 [Argiope bruennichi]|uniref:Uncharacterized protein n=1 Tax=Argiope bruennichi TaxID=94029 RepID=A0A8T0EPJ1_ARGBR|nr:hypothetical protein HNY73_014097 [Argiope bruennichi]
MPFHHQPRHFNPPRDSYPAAFQTPPRHYNPDNITQPLLAPASKLMQFLTTNAYAVTTPLSKPGTNSYIPKPPATPPVHDIS